MPNLKDIRNRIGSVRSTQKITSAMKLVATARLRRAQDAVRASRPYATKMGEVIQALIPRVEEGAHPLLQASEREDRILLIVLTSDRGLAAGFNANLLRMLERFIADRADITDTVLAITVGRKGFQNLNKNKRVTVHHNVQGVLGKVSFAAAREIAQEAIALFTAGEVDRVYLVYNEFVSAIQIIPTVRELLPLSVDSAPAGDDAAAAAASTTEYIYEPSEAALLDHLLPNSVEVQVFQALLESEASEHGARMTAMDNATSNASDMIRKLTLEYNRARQAYITKELVEIVSGAESLKG